MTKYNHTTIENNWRDKWFDDNIYEAVDFSEKPKKYILAELPYPSGAFLHAGHMMRYTVPEIYSRFLRMQGYNVLYPMGWDCFGLPAETFAIAQNKTPQEVIKTAIKNFKQSLKRMGYAFDWNREINTSDPSYYKWTQFQFLKLYNKGLAQKVEMPVWWCDQLGVLADEEVLPGPNGTKVSERGGYPVKKVMFSQWVLKITDYAERLLEDLDKVDYMDSVKTGQINWIGKSVGANIAWEIEGRTVETFTTRHDTIFGVTFLVIAPEHPIVEDLIQKSQNPNEILEYVEKAKSLSNLERQAKDKTGVQIKGVYAKHPFSEFNREIPVFVADYVLLDYGTGVVQGVPAHDERDYEFAQKYNCEVIKVIESPKDFNDQIYTDHGQIINSGDYKNVDSKEFMDIVLERLIKENKGNAAITYKLRDQIFSRQRYWGEPIPLIYKQNGEIEPLSNDQLPLELPKMDDFLPSKDGTSPLARNTKWNQTIDSEGNPATRETDTMPTWAGSNWYYMRYIDPHNDKEFANFEKLKYWLPVDKYFGDAGHTTAHLMYSRFWFKVLFDEGLVPYSEPYNWRMSGGMLLGADNRKMSKSKGNTIDPKLILDTYGADAARTYLAFLGPYEDTYPWNDNGIQACFKLVRQIYELKDKVVDAKYDENENLLSIATEFHTILKSVTSMMEKMKVNTTVSQIMIMTNQFKKSTQIPKDVWIDFIKMIAPIMPFVAEELWQEINNYKTWDKSNSVHLQSWPEYNKALAKLTEIELPIQVNGKVRAKINIETGLSENEIKELVLQDEKIKEYINSKPIKKFIYVQDKIVNIVI